MRAFFAHFHPERGLRVVAALGLAAALDACHGPPTIVTHDAGASGGAGGAPLDGAAATAGTALVDAGLDGSAGASGTGQLDGAGGVGGADASDAADAAAPDATDGSVSDATSDALSEGGSPVCGNSIVEGDEECDDGNTALNDPCDNDCKKLDKFYLVPNILADLVELFDAEGQFVRDFIVDDGQSFQLADPRNAIQIPDGTILVCNAAGAAVLTRWDSQGNFLEVFATTHGSGMDVRNDELLVANQGAIRRFALDDGTPLADLTVASEIRDVLVLPTGWLLVGQGGFPSPNLELRMPNGTLVGVLATGAIENGSQVAHLPDGRVLWTLGGARQVIEILPPTGPAAPDSGATRVDAGGIELDLPGTLGRQLTTSGKPVGVAELADGTWFVTASNGVGGVYDPTSGMKLSSNPDIDHRRFIEPFYAHAECIEPGASDAGNDAGGDAGGCP